MRAAYFLIFLVEYRFESRYAPCGASDSYGRNCTNFQNEYAGVAFSRVAHKPAQSLKENRNPWTVTFPTFMEYAMASATFVKVHRHEQSQKRGFEPELLRQA